MSDDTELLRRYAEDHSEADFTALVQRHFDLVYSAALRQLRGDHHRAREVAQMVFVAAARKAESLARHPAFIGWLYTTTHFAAKKMIRTDWHCQERETVAHALHDASASAESWEQLRPHLDAEMLGLSPTDRAAILLRFFNQRAFSDVGAELGLSESGARMKVERAVGKLRRRLVKRGVTSSAAALATVLAGNAVSAAPAGLSAAVAGSALAEVAGLVAAGASGGVALGLHFMATKTTLGLVAACGPAGAGHRRLLSRAVEGLPAVAPRLESRLRASGGRTGRTPCASAGDGGTDRRSEKPAQSAGGEQSGQGREAVQRDLARFVQPGNRGESAAPACDRSELAGGFSPRVWAFWLVPSACLKLNSTNWPSSTSRCGPISSTWNRVRGFLGKNPATDPSVAPLEQQVREAHATAVLGLVGPEDLQRLQDYDRGCCRPARWRVRWQAVPFTRPRRSPRNRPTS